MTYSAAVTDGNVARIQNRTEATVCGMRTQRCYDAGGLDCRITGHIYRSTAHDCVVKGMTLRRTDSPNCTDHCLQLDCAGRCANEYPIVSRQHLGLRRHENEIEIELPQTRP